MTLVRWQPIWNRHPWNNFPRLQHRMNRFIDDAAETNEDSSVATWAPRISIMEFEDRFEVSAELPGIERDDIKIELQENILSISGEKLSGQESEDRNIHISERHFGQFSRSFRVPSKIKNDEIKAEYKNGVLNLSLPKEEEAKPKKIDIAVD